MKVKLTRDQVLNYVASAGNKCPVCEAENISSRGNFQTDSLDAWRSASCDSCGAEWDDLYLLVGISDS